MFQNSRLPARVIAVTVSRPAPRTTANTGKVRSTETAASRTMSFPTKPESGGSPASATAATKYAIPTQTGCATGVPACSRSS